MCFARQPSPAGKPVLNPSRAGVISCSCQSEIAKLLAQLAEPSRRFIERLKRLERVLQAAPARGARHELRDALCSLMAYRIRVEIAFLSDQSNKKVQRQIMYYRGFRQRQAILIGLGGFRIDRD